MVSVIAQDDAECYDLIVGWDNEYYPEYYSNAMENIQKAQKFLLAEEEQSRIVDSFTT